MKLKDIMFLVLIALLILFSSCQKSLKSPFLDNIKQGDTLTLKAQFAECGEWGGHVEIVTLIKQGNDLRANLYKDSITCPSPIIESLVKESKKLTITDKKWILKYIDSFFVAREKEKGPISNASCIFEITNQGTTYEFIDYKMDWNEFVLMRKAIFEK